MKLRKMIVRTFRVWLGKWHYKRFLHYENIIFSEQEAALKGESKDDELGRKDA